MLSDPTWWIYLVLTIVCAYGFGLFTWWRYKMGGAAPVYEYVRFAFLGIGIETGFGLYSRSYRFIDETTYLEITGGWWWPCRMLIILAIAFLISAHMSYRAFWQRPRLVSDSENVVMLTTIRCREEIADKIDVMNERLTDIEAILDARKKGFKKLIDDIP